MLQQLAPEVVIEILKYIEWGDVLHIRQTSKLLNQFSRTHSVWLAQYHQWSYENLSPEYLEKPLGSYSAAELEYYVLLRRSVDVGWTRTRQDQSRATAMTIDPSQPLTRERPVPLKNVSALHLLPGGRWLFVGMNDGAVNVYDLDSRVGVDPECISVVPGNEGNLGVDFLACDLVANGSDSSTLEVRVTTSPHDDVLDPVLGTTSNRLEVWSINFAHDEHGTTKPSTHRLFPSPSSFLGSVFAFVLRENLVARAFNYHPTLDMGIIELIDWQRSSSPYEHKGVIYMGYRPVDHIIDVRLLPNDKILCLSRWHLQLYTSDIEVLRTQAEISRAASASSRVTKPLWMLSFGSHFAIRWTYLSPAVVGPSQTHLVYWSQSCIFALDIAHDDELAKPTLTKLFSLPPLEDRYCAVGFRKVFLQCNRNTIARVCWSSKGRGGTQQLPGRQGSGQSEDVNHYVATVSQMDSGPFIMPNVFVFDEGTGRIALRNGEGLVIVDTALVYLGK